MRQLVITLLVLIAFSALAATDAELIAAGRAALDRGDLGQAIAQLEKAVAVTPSNSEAHHYLGLAYGRKAQKAGIFRVMSQIGKAKVEWERAVELNPNFVDARLRLITSSAMRCSIRKTGRARSTNTRCPSRSTGRTCLRTSALDNTPHNRNRITRAATQKQGRATGTRRSSRPIQRTSAKR
jgi:Tfp pilus assembly protein PilF